MVGVEKGAASRERRADRSAPGERGPTQGDADRHQPRVERDDLTGAGSEQQRMDTVSALERLSIPTQRLQNAIQRMSRRQSGATPSPDHRFRLQARQCIEAGKGVGANCRTSQPVLGPSGSRNGWRGRNHPAFTTSGRVVRIMYMNYALAVRALVGVDLDRREAEVATSAAAARSPTVVRSSWLGR